MINSPTCCVRGGKGSRMDLLGFKLTSLSDYQEKGVIKERVRYQGRR